MPQPPRRLAARGDGPLPIRSPELTARNRPLVVGSSIGTGSGAVGSIGAFATRDGRRGFITSPAALGIFASDVLGGSVFQPGAVAGAGLSERTRIGTVTAVAIETSETQPTGYVAFVELFDEVEADIALPIAVGTWRAFTGASTPDQTMIDGPVAKLGCATGLTFGVITACDCTVRIRIAGKGRSAHFNGLFEIGAKLESFSLAGDGGAAVFDPVTGSVLGLVVAGGKIEGQARRTYSVPLQPTLQRLGVELVLP